MWKTTESKRTSTGITFLDSIMQGGAVCGGVNAILSTDERTRILLATQIAAEGAFQASLVSSPSARNATMIYMTVDWTVPDLWSLLIAQAAGLSQAEATRLYNSLVAQGSVGSKQIITAAIENARSGFGGDVDVTKQIDAVTMLREHLTICDLHVDEFEKGHSPIETILSQLAAVVPANTPVTGIVIDPIGLAVQRYLNYRKEDHRAFSRMLRACLDDCRERIAAHYQCPVWVVHPIKPSLSSEPSSRIFTGDVAAECRPFAKHVDSMITISNSSPRGKFKIACVKHPRGIDVQKYVCNVKTDDTGVRLVEDSQASGGGVMKVEMSDELREELTILAN